MKTLSLLLVAVLLLAATAPTSAATRRRAQRLDSIESVFYRVYPASEEVSAAMALPRRPERKAFKKLKNESDAGAFEVLDKVYSRSDLKALAFRDSDGDGTPDFRVSDFYGKLGEGDVDLDGDGVRNIYDSAPFDPKTGGEDSDGDGIPDVAGTFTDANSNRLPDHLDWALHKNDSELAAIQLGLFRDFKIILVERSSQFDLPLARAADDAVRLVFGDYFDRHGFMPTLRTIAAEDLALLNRKLAEKAGDATSAQVFAQTQTLVVYDETRFYPDGRPKPAVGVLGVLAHELGHNYQFSLDFAADELEEENARTDYPATNFLEEVAQFGWTRSGWNDADLGGDLPLFPRFVYAGISEPTYLLSEETPDEWNDWLLEIYFELDESPDYLQDERFAEQGVVSDYSLNTPWEWHGENLLAYVIYKMEEAIRREETLRVPGLTGEESVAAAEERIVLALREIWPGFYHRNIAGTAALEYFEERFPIAESDLAGMAGRYLGSILEAPSG